MQKDTAQESTTLQGHRSLVERKIKDLKSFREFLDGHVTPYNRETVEDHYEKLEMTTDNVIACDILNMLAKGDRLATIPQNAHRGAIHRHLTSKVLKPALAIPKALPEDRNQWPVHLRGFWEHLTTIVPQIETQFFGKGRVKPLQTANVTGRGDNLVESGFIAHISVGKDESCEGAWLVMMKIYPSMLADPYLTCFRLVSGNALNDHACACVDG